MTINTNPAPPPHDDIRPIVQQPSGNSAIWIFGTALAGSALLLFYTLETRREGSSAPALTPAAQSGNAVIVAAPELTIPPAVLPDQFTTFSAPGAALPPQSALAQQRVSLPGSVPPPTAQPDRPRMAPQGAPFQGMSPQPYQQSPPSVVYEAPVSKLTTSGNDASAGNGSGNQDERVRAVPFRNPSSTIPKGTVIQAVLESALDSTRAGFARAVVSRDVFGFDGTQVLIQRGSRLIGEYKADLAPGQNRALIQWQRLMRPDGIMINIDSPAADPLGRVGVKGTVNSHFFQRFGGAILQSALDIGVQIAANKATNGTVIYAFPGSLQGLVAPPTEKVQPTLKVRQGTSVSVFVARDLDFTAAGQ